MLVPAKLVDDMHMKARPRDEQDDTTEDTVIEDIGSFAMRLELWVQNHLRSASSSKRDNYKDGHVYQERKTVIHEFIRSTHRKKCTNPSCGA